MTSTANLKPCPFCGGAVQQVLVSVPSSGSSGAAHAMSLEFAASRGVINCQACGTFYQDPDIWNRRPIYYTPEDGNHTHPETLTATSTVHLPSETVELVRQALAHQPSEAVPVAVILYERGKPGRENEMPRVLSCNDMPDGEYRVYLAAPQPIPPRIDAEAVERERGHYYSEAESGWDAQPTAKDALQAIANLPTGKNESEMAGQEDAYRAVEALFAKPPHIECKDAGAVEWHFNRVREEIKAGRTQNALTYISCGIANARAAKSDDYAKGVRAGIDEALQIAREQAALMADLALEGLPESARQHEAMEAALTRFTSKLNNTLSDLVSTAAALRAAPATEANEGVAVKALEWEPAGGDGKMSLRATAIGLRYYVYQNSGDGLWHSYTEGYQMASFGEFFTSEGAKAAAQADYETRIRSALVAPSDARVDPDYCYDPDEWEFTCSWDERDQVHGHGDALLPGHPMKIATLLRGPDKWVAEVPVTWDDAGDPDETEIKWFDSEEAARSALANEEARADG